MHSQDTGKSKSKSKSKKKKKPKKKKMSDKSAEQVIRKFAKAANKLMSNILVL